MRLLLKHPYKTHGNILFTTIAMLSVLGLTLISYLMMVAAQEKAIMRSQAWNSCITIAEAGLEEALTHARFSYDHGLERNGWALVDGEYCMRRDLGSNYFRVRITATQPYKVTSEGYVYLPWTDTYICRTIRVDTISQGLYSKALVVKSSIQMNGNNVQTDSYDSRDPLKSTMGRYNPLLAQANGDVACQDGLVNSLNVGNANVWGRVITGPHATVAIGQNGAVGSATWNQFGQTGIEPGYWLTDMNMNFPAVSPPYNSAPAPTSDGNWTAVVENGNYQCSGLTGKLLVRGHATLYVTGDINYSSTGLIKIQNGASLKLYMGGNKAYIGEVRNENASVNATNLFLFGLNSCKTLDIKFNPSVTGVIYAPAANLDLNGGMEVFGSIVCKSVRMNGHSKFHYDESLSGQGKPRGFIVSAWNEI